MKLAARFLFFAAALALLAGPHLALAQTQPNAGFEKLKSLVGEWEGKYMDGSPTHASYRLVSNGTALMETLKMGKEEMITVYHPDGDRLVVTHYCSANNQPRMRAEGLASDGKSIRFSFVDATNLPTPAAGHMRALEITFVSPESFTQAWTWRENGQDKPPGVFRWTRAN